jgi:signal transduction histidine kinase
MTGRVFWQFFVAIWLTILGAIAVIVLTNTFLKVLPPKGDMQGFRERHAIDTISELVRRGHLASARDFIDTLTGPPRPIKIALEPSKPPIDERDCHGRSPRSGMAFDPASGICYAIGALDKPPTLVETYLPPFMPPVAAMLTSLISAFYLARYLVRPVMVVRSGLSALASGNFAVRISAPSTWWKDEVTALAQDFDVTAGKLEELQDVQRRLFHDVSHELRSPLSRMQAALGLLRQNPAKLAAVMPRMAREIERLDSLVEEILTLARMGSPEAPIVENQSLDVIDLLSAVIDDAGFEAQARAITIAHAGVERFVSRVNGELIYRALENVMRNAVKYSNYGSTIIVTTRLGDDGGLSIEIANEGLYVAPEHVSRIFEPFTRLLENETGHGLGLAITRRAIEFHGGSVAGTSNAGGGLTIVLTLPLQP